MKKSLFSCLPLALLLLLGCSKGGNTTPEATEAMNTFVSVDAQERPRYLEIPIYTQKVTGQTLRRKGYTTSYNRRTKQPDWVAWKLTAEHSRGEFRRDSMVFHEDPDVPAPRATDDDYIRSHYDRGHMCPSGDNKWSAEAQEQSFLLTNVCPQNHTLNEKAWNDLEMQCRRWARKYGAVYIACGPLFEGENIKTIGKNKVSVPTGFFKVVLVNGRNPRAIGYIFENKASSQGRICTVDEVEALTGLDFFSLLNDDIEEKIEATVTKSAWR